MGGSWVVRGLGSALGASVLLAVSCSAPPRNDLAANPQLYRSPGYTAKSPGDRPVFLSPVQDQRKAVALDASRQPVQLLDDTRWVRPPARMLDDVIDQELQKNGVFSQKLKSPRPEACILEIVLLRFHGGIVEEIAGRSTFAEVAFRVRVHGPADAGGKRSVLLENVCEHRQAGEAQLSPPSPLLLLGLATSRAVLQLDTKLDQSNVARSGVPLALEPEKERDGGR